MAYQCAACGKRWSPGHLCKEALVIVTRSEAEARAEYDAAVAELGEKHLRRLDVAGRCESCNGPHSDCGDA